MAFLRKYYSLKGNSILESVIALCIISVCLYIAIMIFAAVFQPRTSAKFYQEQNKVNEMFFLCQLNDSLYDENGKNLLLEKEDVIAGLQKITVRYKDSSKVEFNKSFYVQQGW